MNTRSLSLPMLALCTLLAGCQLPNGHDLRHLPLPEAASQGGGEEWAAPVPVGADRPAAHRPTHVPAHTTRPAPVQPPVFADHHHHAPGREPLIPPTAPGHAQEDATHYESIELPAARVIHVNQQEGYVILACEKMPRPGEDAQLFRGSRPVGDIRFISTRQGRYIVADILSGTPERGDIARYAILFAGENEEERTPRQRRDREGGPARRNLGFPFFSSDLPAQD